MPQEIENQNGQGSFKAALEARRAVLAAMPEDRVMRRLPLDVVQASAVASAAARNVGELRDELAVQFGPRVNALIDGLDTTARAARQADVELGTCDEPAELGGLHDDVMRAYERLILDADSLAVRGFIAKERLAGSRDLRSYQGTLQSLLGVIAVLRESWAEVQAHTPVTLTDLDRADATANTMASALSTRESGTHRAAAAETRTRALSLLVREYEELRRMVTFVRWFEDDAARFTPSLYAGRGGRRAKSEDGTDIDTGPQPAPIAVTGPVPNNGGPAFTT